MTADRQPEPQVSPLINAWAQLPTTDQGKGICDWCQRAITGLWPAVDCPRDDNTVTHFHICPYIEKETTTDEH